MVIECENSWGVDPTNVGDLYSWIELMVNSWNLNDTHWNSMWDLCAACLVAPVHFFFRPNPLQSKKYNYFNPPVHFNFILIQNLWPIQNTPLQTSPIIPVEPWVVRPHFVTYPMVFSWITHINGSKKCKASLENHFTWRIPRNNLVTMGDEPF